MQRLHLQHKSTPTGTVSNAAVSKHKSKAESEGKHAVTAVAENKHRSKATSEGKHAAKSEAKSGADSSEISWGIQPTAT